MGLQLRQDLGLEQEIGGSEHVADRCLTCRVTPVQVGPLRAMLCFNAVHDSDLLNMHESHVQPPMYMREISGPSVRDLSGEPTLLVAVSQTYLKQDSGLTRPTQMQIQVDI